MATTHRILDDFYEESFSLIAIHCSLEDYALVYALNRYLKTQFRRLRTDLDIDKRHFLSHFRMEGNGL